jgi:hypothetical protein
MQESCGLPDCPQARPGTGRLASLSPVAAALVCLILCTGGVAEPPGAAFSRVPLMFEAGGAAAGHRFVCRGPGYAVSLQPSEMVLALPQTPIEESKDRFDRRRGRSGASLGTAVSALRVRLLGANHDAPASALEALPTRINYFLGNDPKAWRIGVPTFARIRYEAVYPGIDLVYYGDQRQLEYDFVVASGADLRQIKLAIEGVRALTLDASGDLVLRAGTGEMRLCAPMAYQDLDGRRRAVPCRFALDGRTATFHVGDYDPRRPLVIDPILAYSTYLGGAGPDRAWSITVDSAGAAYVTGETFSTNFPVLNALDPTFNGDPADTNNVLKDVFVARLDPSGTNLVFATYLGGAKDDIGFDLALAADESIWITGATFSTNFPVTPDALATNIHGKPDQWQGYRYDAFVARLAADGSALLYSTYLGGSDHDNGISLALDPAGNVCITGSTESDDFPTNGVASTFGGKTDAFVTVLTPSGHSMLFSTYLGGSEVDSGEALAVDGLGRIVVAGRTESSDFPVTNAYQAELAGGKDGFVTRYGLEMVSTYLGGSGDDWIYGLDVDAGGQIYLTGWTASQDFPTNRALFGTNHSNLRDAFVTKFDPSGTNLVYSTYLGGSATDEGWSIAADAAGNAFVVGRTASTNFPSIQSVQTAFGGAMDAFAVKINPDGTALEYATYLGGGAADEARAVALDLEGTAYVVGYTSSTNFAVTPSAGSLQSTRAGSEDAFVLKLLTAEIRLRAQLTKPGEITLFWPRSLPGCQLETREALSIAAGWTLVTNAPTATGLENAVTVSATVGQQYFRLRR